MLSVQLFIFSSNMASYNLIKKQIGVSTVFRVVMLLYIIPYILENKSASSMSRPINIGLGK